MCKAIIGILVVLFIICAVISLCSGCATRPVVIATDESIIAGQVSTERLAGINGTINEILSVYDRFIADANQRAIDRNIDAEEALDRYDEFVQYCIRSLREIERTSRGVEGQILDPVQGSDSGGSPLLD
jgi:hypothetical protein